MYKAECERHGFAWGAVEQRAMRDAVRSCTRGMGGPQKALPIPFESLHLLPGCADPWAPGGPVKPRNVVVLGCWFMVREVEAANAKVKDLQVNKGPDGKPVVLWTLPVSKTDQQAKGTSRNEGGNQTKVDIFKLGFEVLGTLHLRQGPPFAQEAWVFMRSQALTELSSTRGLGPLDLPAEGGQVR